MHFYAKLQKSGRRQEQAQIKTDFTSWLKEHHTTMAALAKSAGVGIWSLKQLKKGRPIEKDHALKLAQAMGEDWKALFKVLRDMAPTKTRHYPHLSPCLCLPFSFAPFHGATLRRIRPPG